MDFNVWLGPAAEQPYHGNLVHYNWHWFWDFGNGDMGNQGMHEMDVARWAIPGATLPKKVWSLGGRFAVDDQGETPNTLLSVFEFDEATLLFETRGLVEGEHPELPRKVGNEYYTDQGMIAEGMFHPHGGGAAEPLADVEAHVTDGGSFGSFLSAVRSRDPGQLNANAEVAHYSSALCHLGNISYRLGEKAAFDSQAQSLGDDKLVYESFMNIQANLKGVGVRLEETTYQLGRPLEFDAQAEKFVGESAVANPMLTREYRAPFVVPENV